MQVISNYARSTLTCKRWLGMEGNPPTNFILPGTTLLHMNRAFAIDCIKVLDRKHPCSSKICGKNMKAASLRGARVIRGSRPRGSAYRAYPMDFRTKKDNDGSLDSFTYRLEGKGREYKLQTATASSSTRFKFSLLHR